MTVEIFEPAPIYTIQNAGPFAVPHPYETGSIRAAVIADGEVIDLGVADFAVSPASTTTEGSLSLAPAVALLHTGRQLTIWRETDEEQGWQGVLGEREKGLEVQLDRLTMILQELRETGKRSLRSTVPIQPFAPADGHTIVFEDGNPVVGPSAVAIGDAAENAALAQAAAEITLQAANFTVPSLAALLADQRAFAVGAIIQTRAEGFSYEVVSSGAELTTAGGIGLRVLRQGVRLTPQQFGAIGDGLTDDTAAWTAFQAATGQKQVPPGSYLVGGIVKRFDRGVLGNGEFNNTLGYWTQVQGDLVRDSAFVHGRILNIDDSLLASPAIKTQTVINYSDMDPTGNNFTRVIGAYHEAIGQGDYNLNSDANNNFTVFGVTAHNRFAGMVGMTAITGRVWDARESEVPNINVYGASKSAGGYFPFVRRSRFASGGYMIGIETYCQNTADETLDVPYINNDFLMFTEGSGWTCGYHCTAMGGGGSQKGAPITAGILIDGMSAARHGFWNAIIIGASGMKVNNVPGYPGTVGINFGSWASAGSFGDQAIRFGAANRHLFAKAGLKIRSSLTRILHELGDCGLQVEAGAAALPFIKLMQGADDTGSPTTTELASFYASPTATYLRATPAGGEVRLAPNNASLYYFANSARWAPSPDGVAALGSASNRWSTVYASTGAINTSDARMKLAIEPMPDQVLDAWGQVEYRQYLFTDAVAEKGADARLHSGVVAQQVIQAFAEAGLNASDYGLLCHDSWDALEEVTETIRVEVEPEGVDDAGNVVTPALYRDEVTIITPAREAGDRYSIRYEEALAMEAAYLRRCNERFEARLAALESAMIPPANPEGA